MGREAERERSTAARSVHRSLQRAPTRIREGRVGESSELRGNVLGRLPAGCPGRWRFAWRGHHMALLLSVAVLGLVGSAHGWVTVSPQGRVTIKAETQIGCATIVLAAFGESLDAQHAGQLRGACLPCLQALGTSRGGRPPKVAVCHRRRKRWARPK